MSLIAEIASDEVLALAYVWICQRRKEYPEHADVWWVRQRWEQVKPDLQRKCLRKSIGWAMCRESAKEELNALIASKVIIATTRRTFVSIGRHRVRCIVSHSDFQSSSVSYDAILCETSNLTLDPFATAVLTSGNHFAPAARQLA